MAFELEINGKAATSGKVVGNGEGRVPNAPGQVLLSHCDSVEPNHAHGQRPGETGTVEAPWVPLILSCRMLD